MAAVAALAAAAASARAVPPQAGGPAADRLGPASPWPVVVVGADLATLQGIPPAELVAFRWDGAWRQVPVQVDERDVVDYAARIYAGQVLGRLGWSGLTYTDPNTFTGPDRDAMIDADDEIVFMARDAGPRPASWSEPQGVAADSGVEVEASDPLSGRTAWLYLFRSAAAMDAAAGKRYVRYDFRLKAGSYREHYNLRGTMRGGVMGKGDAPANPEDSAVATPFYTRHFSDRWISDGLSIRPPLGDGANLLDMDKALFAPGNPARSVLTFSAGHGAFVVNKSGPVRAVRSYVGCNSGPLTQRTHLFYDRLEENLTHLRVHAIPGVVCFLDYSGAVLGMRYSNNHNPEGVVVDGRPDEVRGGPLLWEMLQGRPGALVVVHGFDTDIGGLDPQSYYLDERNAKVRQVGGDAHAFGASGPWIRRLIPNTDPRARGQAARLILRRTFLYEGRDAAAGTADRYAREAACPLIVRMRPIRGDRGALPGGAPPPASRPVDAPAE